MKMNDTLICMLLLSIVLSLNAIFWFYLGYQEGHRQGQKDEQIEMRKRLDEIEALHKQQEIIENEN